MQLSWLGLHGKRLEEQDDRDHGSGEDRDRAGEKHRDESAPSRNEPESGTAESERHVEEHGVSPHREAAVLRRRAADGFSAKARIDQRIAKAGESSAGRAQHTARREPNEREAGRLDKHGN